MKSGDSSNPYSPQTFPANIYLFKVNNRNIRKRCGIYSKSTIKTPEYVIDIVLVFYTMRSDKFGS